VEVESCFMLSDDVDDTLWRLSLSPPRSLFQAFTASPSLEEGLGEEGGGGEGGRATLRDSGTSGMAVYGAGIAAGGWGVVSGGGGVWGKGGLGGVGGQCWWGGAPSLRIVFPPNGK
jgi:hypothetical protein